MKRLTLKFIPILTVLLVATLLVSAQSVETRHVSNFTGIASEGPFNVHVKIDGTEGVKLSSELDVIKVIETVVKNGTLIIKFKDDLHNGEGNTSGPIDIYVSAKTLSSLVKTGSGSISVDDGNLTGNAVRIVITGSGNITSSVKSESLNVVITGSGTVALKGTTNKGETTINGPGLLNSKHLEIKEASVLINGSGSAYLTADNSLLTRVNGTGNIIYSGNPKVIGGGAKKAE